jgi:hypothetical protein
VHSRCLDEQSGGVAFCDDARAWRWLGSQGLHRHRVQGRHLKARHRPAFMPPGHETSLSVTEAHQDPCSHRACCNLSAALASWRPRRFKPGLIVYARSPHHRGHVAHMLCGLHRAGPPPGQGPAARMPSRRRVVVVVGWWWVAREGGMEVYSCGFGAADQNRQPRRANRFRREDGGTRPDLRAAR